jgi:hypothetical protein
VTSPNREVPMTLLEFIVSRHAGDNPRGDFIRDTREVQRLPRFGEGCALYEYEKLKREFERHRAAPRVAKRWPLRREA